MTLQSLLERVESASGADRELDAEVAWELLEEDWSSGPERAVTYPFARIITLPAYTASLDATLALVERVLPGHQMLELYQCEDGSWGAHWRRPETETAYALTPALALLAAMLRAKIGEDQ